MDDDGFESLDGNGSSDSNKEEQDLSLTAAEFETALKNSPVHGDSSETDLVIFKCCPKFNRQSTNVSSQHFCKNDKDYNSGEQMNSTDNEFNTENCFNNNEKMNHMNSEEDASAINCASVLEDAHSKESCNLCVGK